MNSKAVIKRLKNSLMKMFIGVVVEVVYKPPIKFMAGNI